MTSEPERLIEKLDELVSVLDSYGETRWRGWIAKSVRILRTGDLSGADHFVSAFGGMGSIADLVIDARHGDPLTESEMRAANERSGELLSEAYGVAQSICRKER